MSNETASPPISAAAARRRANVARTRRWHDRRRAERRPEPRDIDHAISEAAAFVVTLQANAVDTRSYTIDARALVDVAKLALREMGFAEVGLRELIVRRLKSRPDHRDRRQLLNHYGVDDHINVRQPRRGGEPWTERDAAMINRIVRSHSPNVG